MRNIILIVDSTEGNRQKLDEILADSFTIMHAENEKQAIECITNYASKICAIITANSAQSVDGLQIIKYMGAMELFSKIPIIICSTFNAEDDNIKEWADEVDEVILRPFDAITVRRRVRNLVELYNYRRGQNYKV